MGILDEVKSVIRLVIFEGHLCQTLCPLGMQQSQGIKQHPLVNIAREILLEIGWFTAWVFGSHNGSEAVSPFRCTLKLD